MDDQLRVKQEIKRALRSGNSSAITKLMSFYFKKYHKQEIKSAVYDEFLTPLI